MWTDLPPCNDDDGGDDDGVGDDECATDWMSPPGDEDISYTNASIHTPLTLIFPEGLLRSPQTTPPQPPVERNEKSPLKTFNDYSRGTLEQQQHRGDVRDYGSSMSKSFDQQPTTDPHNYGSSSKSSFDDSSLPSLAPSRPHTSSCAKVQTS